MDTANIPQILNIIGLLLDITGVIILFKYGLPADVNPYGHTYLIAEQEDDQEKIKAKKYKKLSRMALTLIIIGCLFQASSSVISIYHPFANKDQQQNQLPNTQQP